MWDLLGFCYFVFYRFKVPEANFPGIDVSVPRVSDSKASDPSPQEDLPPSLQKAGKRGPFFLHLDEVKGWW